MYQLIIKAAAIEMAYEAYYWYEEKLKSLADRFFAELEAGYDKIEKQPLLYAEIDNDFRHFVLRTFPFVIVFRIVDNYVVVHAVFHTKRDPQWKFPA